MVSNFLNNRLRQHRQWFVSIQSLGFVAGPVGCPISASLGLACFCCAVIEFRAICILHWCSAGLASWYDFAVAIGECVMVAGLLEQVAQVHVLATPDYTTPARGSIYFLLDSSPTFTQLGSKPQHWLSALREVMADVDA